MGCDFSACACRNVEKMDGMLEHDAAVNAEVRAIFPERGVERGENVAAHVGVTAEMLLDALGSAAFAAAVDGFGQRTDEQAVGQVAEIGKLGREVAVDENQLASGAGYAIGLELRGGNLEFAVDGAAERGLREGRQIGETPVFIV